MITHYQTGIGTSINALTSHPRWRELMTYSQMFAYPLYGTYRCKVGFISETSFDSKEEADEKTRIAMGILAIIGFKGKREHGGSIPMVWGVHKFPNGDQYLVATLHWLKLEDFWKSCEEVARKAVADSQPGQEQEQKPAAGEDQGHVKDGGSGKSTEK